MGALGAFFGMSAAQGVSWTKTATRRIPRALLRIFNVNTDFPPQKHLLVLRELLGQDHREVSKHGEQHAGDSIANREADPRYIGLK
jgi:hypothetical protein